MRAGRILIRIIRFSPRQFWSLVLCAFVIYCLLPVPLGLLTRAFFDAVTNRDAGLNVWTAVALLVAVQLAQVAGELALTLPWSGLQQRTFSLLQHNLFAGIFRGYGRHGLPEPPAAAISRFRDEPMAITSGSLDAICDLIGRVMFAIAAGAVMWRINHVATLAAFVPVLVTSVITDALGRGPPTTASPPAGPAVGSAVSWARRCRRSSPSPWPARRAGSPTRSRHAVKSGAASRSATSCSPRR